MAASYSVQLKFDSNGLEQRLRKLYGETSRIEDAVAKLKSGFERAGAAGVAARQKIKRGLDAAGAAMSKLIKNADGLSAALAGLSFGALIAGGSKLATTAAQFERLQILLRSVTGSAKGADAAMKAVYETTAVTGQSTQEAARGLAQMLIAARGTSFEGRRAVDTFKQLNMLTIAYSGTAEQAERAQQALQQMMSKGVLSMEELRGQLGDALPGAMELFRRSYKDGTTSLQDFMKLVGDGKVTINDFTNLNKVLAGELDKVYGKGFSDYIAQQAKFNQAMDRLKLVAGQVATVIGNALLPKITGLINWVANGNPKLLALVGTLGAIAAAVVGVSTAVVGLAASLAVVNTALTALGITKGAKQLGKYFAAGLAGPPQVKALTLLAAAALGAGATLGAKKLYDEFDQTITKMQNRLKGILQSDFQLPQNNVNSDLNGDSSSDAVKTASELNQLLMEQLRLNSEAGVVGKDKISQLRAQRDLIDLLIPLQLKQQGLERSGAALAIARLNVSKAGKIEADRIIIEYQEIQKQIQGLVDEANELRDSLLGKQLASTESPLTAAVRQVKDELIAADKKAEDLLNKLNDLGGTNPETSAARTALGNLRGDIAGADPLKLASEKLAGGDIESLKKQNAELQAMGRQLSTLDQLMLKYGEDWAKLHPSVRQHLTDLAQTSDKLRQMQQQQQIYEDTVNGIGNAIRDGLGNALVLAVSETEKLGEAMQNLASEILKAIGQMLILNALKAGIGALAGSDGFGFFSILAGDFGKRAAGGPVAPNSTYLVGENGPELLEMGSSGGYVYNNQQTQAMSKYSPSKGGATAAGGSVAGGGEGASPITLNVTATRIADDNWVKVDDLQVALAATRAAAARDGAKAGYAKTLGSLRNSRSARTSVGL